MSVTHAGVWPFMRHFRSVHDRLGAVEAGVERAPHSSRVIVRFYIKTFVWGVQIVNGRVSRLAAPSEKQTN